MKILVSGDDGYQALGLRLVATTLKTMGHDVKIAATKTERSSSGGYFVGSGEWGKDEVDGIEALWVNGAPADAVECASAIYGTDFDLVVSGMNMGPNVGVIFSSGTIGATMRALSRNIAQKGIALSWAIPDILWDQDSTTLPLADYQDHPGKAVRTLLELAIKNDLWSAEFLNCNIPQKAPSQIIFCSPTRRENWNYYKYAMEVDYDEKTYKKVRSTAPAPHEAGIAGDAVPLTQGNITVVPWLSNFYVNEALLKLEGKKIVL